MSAINDLAKLILAQMTQDDAGRLMQSQIDNAMAGAIGDVKRGNPNQLAKPAQPVANTATLKVRNGWVEPRELPVPSKFETELVDAMARKFCGGPNDPVK